MKHAAILGCGPAGLLAAHACQINGVHFDIYSKKRKSTLFGSQYLHEPISGITDLPVEINYSLVGDMEGYREKVYGLKWDGDVSPSKYEGDHHAWDIRTAYDRLWHRYEGNIHDTQIGPEFQFWTGMEHYDYVLSTVPRTVFRQPGDNFEFSTVWAVGDAPEIGQFAPFSPREDNVVICDGTRDVGWYRLSKIFGHTTIEWPEGKRPPVEGIAAVFKPLKFTSKSEWSHKWHFLGRYGKWEKGVLSTDAFNEALKITRDV